MGLVFVLGLVLLGVGVVLMVISAIRNPGFFRGEIIHRGTSVDPADDLVMGDLIDQIDPEN